MLVILLTSLGARSRYSSIWKKVSNGIIYRRGDVDTTGSYRIEDSVLASDAFNASASWNPSDIVDGNEDANDITIAGAALGDFCLVGFSLDVQDLVLDAQVTSTDTVTVVLSNNTGTAVNLGSGTIYVRVIGK